MQANIDALQSAVADIEKQLRRLPFDYDIFASAETGLDFEIKRGTLTRHTRAEESGIALRLFHRGQLGFAYTRNLTPPFLSQMVNQAKAGVALCDRHAGFALAQPRSPVLSAKDLDLYDATLAEFPFEEKLTLLKNFESDIFSSSPAVCDTDATSWTETTGYTEVLTRQGFGISCRETALAVGAEAIARRQKKTASFGDAQHVRFFHDLSLHAWANHLAQQASLALGARKPQSGQFPVVLENQVAAELLEVIAPSFFGDEVGHHRSFLEGKLGTDIFSPLISILDDGRLRRAWGSCWFDAEGCASRRNTLVKNGTLVGFLHDTHSGRQAGTPSTGNSKREGLGSLPRVGHHNFFIQNGATAHAELLWGLNPGALITKVIGIHLANPLTGDFAVGASGFWVNRGRLAFPIDDFTLSGNLFEMLKAIVALGSDLKINGGFGSPSWLVPALKLAGT